MKQGTRIRSTYRKGTAANTFLKATSHHPKSLINGIPTGQFLRLRRNCSQELDYRTEVTQLYKCFRERKYSHRTLGRSKPKASKRSQIDLLQLKTNKDDPQNKQTDQVRIFTPYGLQWEAVRNVLTKHWHLQTRSPVLFDIVGPRLLMVAKRARNLADELINSECIKTTPWSWLTDLPALKGMYPCGKCSICSLVERTNNFTDADRHKVYEIGQFIN